MRNFWLVAKHEYLKRAGKRSFLIATLGVPLLIILVIGVSIMMAIGGGKDLPLGYVDQAGILIASANLQTGSESEPVEMRHFSDEAAAQAALEKQEIQAYYILPPDYLQSRQVSLYYWDEAPGESVQDDFAAFVRASLTSGLPEDLRQRAVDGIDITLRSMDGGREIGSQSWVNFLIPFVAGFFFVFTVMSSAGYLLQVVTDEKENRTIEILVTSLSPEQLIGGKAFGLMAVALTQISIWVLAIVVGLVVGAQFLEPLQNVRVPWDFLFVAALFFFPTYALVAGLMTAIGGAVTEMQHGQQIAGILNLFFVMPYFLTVLIFADPHSPLLVGLTLFPTTAFTTVTLRWAMTVIPAWQLAVSWLVLMGSAGLSIWASSRIFRVGMLRYGQDLSLKAAFQALRSKG